MAANPHAAEVALRVRMSGLADHVAGLLDRGAMLDVLAAPDWTGLPVALLRYMPGDRRQRRPLLRRGSA